MSDAHVYPRKLSAMIDQIGTRMPSRPEWDAILEVRAGWRVRDDRREYMRKWTLKRKIQKALNPNGTKP